MTSLLDTIENPQEMGDALCQRVPETGTTSLQIGAQLVARKGEVAVFVRDGQALDSFSPGQHTISADAVPLIKETLGARPGDGDSFDAIVYFVNAGERVPVRWGTREPILVSGAEGSEPQPVRGFGELDVQITDPRQFVAQVAGVQGAGQADEIRDRVREIAVQSLCEALGEWDRPVSEIAQSIEDITAQVRDRVQQQLGTMGIALRTFVIGNILLPEPAAGAATSTTAPAGEANDGSLVIDRYGWPTMREVERWAALSTEGTMQPAGDTEILTAAEAAEYLQLSEAEVMELIQSGALKARKIGTRYLVAKTRLDEWMSARAKRR